MPALEARNAQGKPHPRFKASLQNGAQLLQGMGSRSVALCKNVQEFKDITIVNILGPFLASQVLLP